MVKQSILDSLIEYIQNVSGSAKVIDSCDIIVSQWVRYKCQYGCSGYGRYFSCPPYSPSVAETRQMVSEYKSALLIKFKIEPKAEKNINISEIMFEIERKAFLDGLYRAFAFSAGPCRLCDSCVASSVENANQFSKRLCRHQNKARPSMESCGIDVYETARKAGYEIDVVKNYGDCYNRVGLLMLD